MKAMMANRTGLMRSSSSKRLGHCAAVVVTILAAVSLAGPAAATGSAKGSANGSTKADTSRLITIGGDVTEIVHALGLGDRIVAVDTTSSYPPEIAAKTKKVGYMRALAAEGILSLGPTLILASDGAGPPPVIKALKAASVTYVAVPDKPSAEGIAEKIRAVGVAVGRDAQAARLAATVKRALVRLGEVRRKITAQRSVLFVLSVQGGRLIVGGADTSADAIIRLSGGRNAAAHVKGYKPVTPEALIEMAPDAILTMARTRRGPSAADLYKMPALKLIPAGRAGGVREMDGLYLLGFGPRTPLAARDARAVAGRRA